MPPLVIYLAFLNNFSPDEAVGHLLGGQGGLCGPVGGGDVAIFGTTNLTRMLFGMDLSSGTLEAEFDTATLATFS